VFDAWQAAQLRPAAAPSGGEASAGAAVFQHHCSTCHAVRGTPAHGSRGPDLTHLMSRQTLAAGVLPNDTGALSGWISNPGALKPGAKMPATNLSGPDLLAVTAYLETLQ
jgi:cytochrome c oxidase subunit 2